MSRRLDPPKSIVHVMPTSGEVTADDVAERLARDLADAETVPAVRSKLFKELVQANRGFAERALSCQQWCERGGRR